MQQLLRLSTTNFCHFCAKSCLTWKGFTVEKTVTGT